MPSRMPIGRYRSPVVAVAAAVAILVSLPPSVSFATAKDECVDAHGRGQDARGKGQLTRARQLFLACAQSSCPSLIQGDCARFGEDIERLLPTVSFVARDSRSVDLPNTSVYVDDVLLTSRLDDGRIFEVDPGKHVIRFAHDGKETTLKVVLNQGEKGRVLAASFASASTPAPPTTATSTSTSTSTTPAPPAPSRSIFPLVVAGFGGAALVTGGVLFALGINKVPANCSVASKDCAAPPGDAAFNDAHNGMSMANVGAGVAIGGAVVLLTGLVLYLTSRPTATTTTGQLVQPWATRGASGLAVTF